MKQKNTDFIRGLVYIWICPIYIEQIKKMFKTAQKSINFLDFFLFFFFLNGVRCKMSVSVVSVPVELKLRLHTTHPPDFWYGKRSSQYLLLYQKSSAWVVCRRRYGHFTMERTKNKMTISPPTHNPCT